MSSGFVWARAPAQTLIPAIGRYGERAKAAMFAVAEYMAQVIVDHARMHAPWTDRTGNARAALHAIAVMGRADQNRFEGQVSPETEAIVSVAGDVVVIFLSHGMSYGRYLETIAAGKWAIIMPALEAHYEQVMRMVRGVLR